MKTRSVVITAAILLIVAAVTAIFLINRNKPLTDANVKALDGKFVQIIEIMPLKGDREYAVFYESSEGTGVVHFAKMPVLGTWQAKEHAKTLFEKGISQNYMKFEGTAFAIIYGEFTPAEDYNLPIRLRNLEDGYDEKPKYIENESGDIIWYQYLDKQTENPDNFQVYNEITGTVISR